MRGLGIGFGLERIGLLAVRAPVPMAVALVAVLLTAVLSLPQVRFDDDINRVFLSDSALSQGQRAMEAEGPPVSTIAVLVEAQDGRPLSADALARLRDLALDLELTPGVASVASPFALRFGPGQRAFADEAVFPAEISAEEVATRLVAFGEAHPDLPRLITPSGDALLISALINLEQTPLAAATNEVRALVDGLALEGVRATLTGEDVIGLEIVAGLKADLVFLNALGLGMVAFAALLVLRHGRLTVLAVVPGAAGAMVVLALSVWLGFPITVVSNVVPILVLVLGVADGVHLARYLKSAETPERVAETVRVIGPACALAAVTTAIAFGGVLVSGNAQLREFALLGSVGVLLAFVVMIVSFALLAQVIRPAARDVPDLSVRFARRIGRFGAARPRAMVAWAVVVIILGVWGYRATVPWFPIYQNLPSGSATLEANDRITGAFGGTFQAWVEVPQTGDPEIDWTRLRAVWDALAEQVPQGTMLSEVSLAAWFGTPDAPLSAAQRADVPALIAERLRPAGGNVARIAVSLPEPMRSEAALLRFEAVERVATTAGAEAILGLPSVMRYEALRLIRQLSLGLILACLAAAAVIAIAFREARLIPVLLLPNLLPVLLVASALHLLTGGQISPVAVLALTLAFGIAVDDTIHFLSRYRDALAEGAHNDAALEAAIRTAGEVMVVTTLLLSLGLAVTLLSGFQPIRLFGMLMILALWIALIVDLMVLPALLRLKGHR